MEKKGNQIKL